ncbi:nitrogen regulatory protein P-II, partial [Trifolium medium]|nr:nitrogen regulatory protein P-II [Trifolium medium]
DLFKWDFGVSLYLMSEFDAHGVSKERHGGSEFSEDRVKMEIVVRKDQVCTLFFM